MPLLGTRGAASATGFGFGGKQVPTVIGQPFGGGYYAGQISTAGNGVADYYLILAGRASGVDRNVKWKTSDTSTSGTSSVINGPANSANMNNASHPAAQFCEGLTIGGYTDWYMPAINELEICYYNFKPTTSNNSTSSGINTNAVPSRTSNYTTGTPARTPLPDFQWPAYESFQQWGVWSSTEYSAAYARLIQFNNGDSTYTAKSFNSLDATVVRAVRRIPV